MPCRTRRDRRRRSKPSGTRRHGARNVSVDTIVPAGLTATVYAESAKPKSSPFSRLRGQTTTQLVLQILRPKQPTQVHRTGTEIQTLDNYEVEITADDCACPSDTIFVFEIGNRLDYRHSRVVTTVFHCSNLAAEFAGSKFK